MRSHAYDRILLRNKANSGRSLSIFGLLDRTSSAMGRRMLKFWLKRPLLNPRSIDERHDCISFFLVTIMFSAQLSSSAVHSAPLQEDARRFEILKAMQSCIRVIPPSLSSCAFQTRRLRCYNLWSPLAHVLQQTKDVPSILRRIRQVRASVSDWFNLMQSCHSAQVCPAAFAAIWMSGHVL